MSISLWNKPAIHRAKWLLKSDLNPVKEILSNADLIAAFDARSNIVLQALRTKYATVDAARDAILGGARFALHATMLRGAAVARVDVTTDADGMVCLVANLSAAGSEALIELVNTAD